MMTLVEIGRHALRGHILLKASPSMVRRNIIRDACSSNRSASSLVLRSDDASTGIATLTLNRPETRNALSRDALDALRGHVDDVASDSAIRVLVIGASGTAFCSGHDLAELHGHRNAEETRDLFETCSEFMTSLRDMPQPVIAQVQGAATAAGCQLVASCDLAVASSDARFGASGINLGLFCSTPAVALSRCVPRKRALRMLLTGDLISAEEARSCGLVNDVVPHDMLQVETEKLARTIATKSGFAVRLGKRMFYDQLKIGDLEEAYDLATDRICRNVDHPDAKRGIGDFVNKRR